MLRASCLVAVAKQWEGDFASDQVPTLSGGKSKAAAKWESHVVYQPNVAILGDTVYDFYVRSLVTLFKPLCEL